ncbi:hypothetical protein LEMLEM_LOCUS16904, partial [Lemmus lemmus]
MQISVKWDSDKEISTPFLLTQSSKALIISLCPFPFPYLLSSSHCSLPPLSPCPSPSDFLIIY